ncbi:MAG TPA: IS110 family transposase [Acidimicrobiales bacterium]|nr:IS110 family transposase [Acidimicrobiales bacterium]
MHLAEHVDFVIGVDTHKQSHTLGLVTATGADVEDETFATDAFGYKKVLAWTKQRTAERQRRCWAIEGTGSFGSGLTTYLLEQGEWVIEIDRPKRPARRNGAKSDVLDAYRAAREALARRHLAQPRRRGVREAIRVLLCTREGAVRSRSRALCHLQALIVNAPAQLRDQLRRDQLDVQVKRCARLRVLAEHSVEHRSTVRAPRATARRIQMLSDEADDLETELALLVAEHAPELLAEPGVGTISAAQVINAWSHPGRIRSEAAFAMLSGSAPVPASSGQVVRHRLNRSGDRQLNRALHTIVLSRMRFHPETRDYVTRRTSEGLTPREIKRCLKRYVARRIFRLLEAENVEPKSRHVAA